MPVTISSPDLGGQGVNIWHMRNDGSDETAGPELNHLTFYDAVSDLFHGSTTIAFDGSLWKVGSGDPELRTGLDSWSVTGGTSVSNLPPANCLCVSWRTSSPTRSGHGRTFLGPVSRDTLQDNGTPTEEARATIVAAAAALIDDIDDPSNGALGVWSVKEEVLRDFVSAAVANKFAVLRSRRD